MEFKVGDRVRIKTWEQMEKEFGKDSDGDINCIPCFNKGMKCLCGQTATIDKICDCNIELKDWSGESGEIHWGFSTDMIELVDTSKFTKSDLQEGDIVTDREGDKSLYLNGEFIGLTLNVRAFTDDLKDTCGLSEYDIIKVERPIKLETVFDRKEVIEMTVEEISRALGHEVKVVK